MNKRIALMAGLILVLAAIAIVLIFTGAPQPTGHTDTHDEHEGEHAEEATTQEAPVATTNQSTPQTPAAKGPRTHVLFQTSMGDFEVELFDDLAPNTVKNFVTLVNKGYYNGLIFHRVIAGFMSQSGDPTGTGRGGPGYTINDEVVPGLKHDKPGILAMAKTAAPNSAGSQFYITAAPAPHLDGTYTIFGQVVKGLDVTQAINRVKTGPGDKPLTPVVMNKVTVVGPSGASAGSTATQ